MQLPNYAQNCKQQALQANTLSTVTVLAVIWILNTLATSAVHYRLKRTKLSCSQMKIPITEEDQQCRTPFVTGNETRKADFFYCRISKCFSCSGTTHSLEASNEVENDADAIQAVGSSS